MSRAEELAQRLTDLGPIDFDDVAGPAAAELRRLSAVEAELIALKKAIGDAEPVAWIRPSGKAMLEAGGYCTVYLSSGMSNHSVPLYTLKGIK